MVIELSPREGDADTNRHIGRGSTGAVWNAAAGEFNADAFGDRRRAGEVSERQHDRKLLATVTRDRIVGAKHPRARDGGDVTQCFVAGSVAIGIVIQLKIIDVDHEQAQR